MLRRLYAFVRELDDRRADALLALVVTVGALVEIAFSDPRGDSRTATIVVTLIAIPFPIAWRRRDPLVATVVFAAVALGQTALDTFFLKTLDATFFAMLVLLYSIGRHAEGARFWAAAGLLLVSTEVAFLSELQVDGAQDFVFALLLFAPPLLAGRTMRSRRRLQDELRERARLAEQERDARALEAADRERDRIATELQAAVANAVSAIVVQAGTVPRLVAAGHAGKAADTFQAIETTGRDALVEMRRLLGILRREGEGAELAPQPGLRRLGSLVERMRREGLEVELSVRGAERTPTAGVDLTAYRVIQDTLEAAAEQGAARAAIELRYGTRDLELTVRDDRSGDASERLPGLRDRVGLLRRSSPRRASGRRVRDRGAAPARRGGHVRKRLSERDWRVIDRVFVGVLLCLGQLELWTSDIATGDRAGTAVLVAAMTLALLWRRTFPLAVLLLVLALCGLGEAFLIGPPGSLAQVLVLITAAYSVGAHSDGRAAVAGLVIAWSACSAWRWRGTRRTWCSPWCSSCSRRGWWGGCCGTTCSSHASWPSARSGRSTRVRSRSATRSRSSAAGSRASSTTCSHTT